MSTKVTITTTPANRVSISGQKREVIRTVSIAPEQLSNRLEELVDVDATDSDNNEVLVYDEATDKYVIKTLPAVDGGIF